MSNVLVTGGAGYIGSHACKALAQAGFTPVAYDNLVNGHKWAVKWGPLEIGDVADQETLGKAIEKYNPVSVMHFAAFAYVGESVKRPHLYYQNNLAGTIALLSQTLEHKIEYFVFSSSCAVYGVPDSMPITEDTPLNPINPYGAGKLFVERILKDYDQAYGLRSISLRYFNACGADPEAEVGEEHCPETHLIPLALSAARGQNEPLKIFGTSYPTPDGTCIRDYIHVSDLAQAHVKALEHLLAGGPTNTFNLGVGQGFSVREIVEAIGRITGLSVPAISAPPRPGDPPELVADNRQAMNILGFKPRYPELADIIGTAWRWMNASQLEEKQG